MMRTLYDEIAALATEQGVTVESGYAAELNGMRRVYPMLLWIPADPKKFEGRGKQRYITYHCRFYLMDKDDRKMPAADREQKWAEMERQAYAMVLKLGETDTVQRIEDIGGERDKHMLTPDGEISVKMEFTCQYIPCDD